MNTKRTVYEKINSISPKVELSQVEVALSLIDDLRKQANTSSKLNAENINLIEKVRSNFKESLSILKKVESETQKGYKMALDLGVGESLYKEFLSSVQGDISVNQKLLQKYS